MPRRVRKAPRKHRKAPRRKVRGRRTAVRSRAVGSMGNTAHITESIELSNISGQTFYEQTFTLAESPRALAMAAYFQEYSLVKVTEVFEPITPLGSNPTMPEIAAYGPARKGDFYWVRNPDAINLITVNLGIIQEMGARVTPFGSSTARNVSVSYRPNIVDMIAQDPANNEASATMLYTKRASKQRWLSTRQPSGGSAPASLDNTIWQGHYFYIDDPLSGVTPTALPTARVTLEFTWAFRRPLVLDTPSEGAPALVRI